MLISEFSREAGLPVDTVRFYIRRGLLRPETNGKGGRNPYQSFTDEHVATARFIRFAQTLGMSLSEIAAINAERRRGDLDAVRRIEILTDQLQTIERRMDELAVLAGYLRTKVAWIRGGEEGPAPPWRRHHMRLAQGLAEEALGGGGVATGGEPEVDRLAQVVDT